MQRRKASRKIIKLFFSQIIFLFTRHPLINSDERLIYLTYPSYPSSSFFLVVRAGLATEDYLQPLPPPPTKLYKKSCEHTEAAEVAQRQSRTLHNQKAVVYCTVALKMVPRLGATVLLYFLQINLDASCAEAKLI